MRRYLRYMDELLLFGDAKETLWESSRHVGAFLGSELRLKLKPAATVPAPVSEGVPFLGLRVWPAVRRLSRRRKTRFLRAPAVGIGAVRDDGRIGRRCRGGGMADTLRA